MRGKTGEITTEMAIAMTIIAVFGIVGFTTNTEAYKILNPTLASFVRSLEIVFAQIAQIVAFHNFPSPTSIVGSTLVIISVLPSPMVLIQFHLIRIFSRVMMSFLVDAYIWVKCTNGLCL